MLLVWVLGKVTDISAGGEARHIFPFDDVDGLTR
jgi:hypothetical protein